MFVKVVHSDNSHTLFECNSYQYSRNSYGSPDWVGDEAVPVEPNVEILLCNEEGAVINSLSFIEEYGNKRIYVMNSEGKTIETYRVGWPLDSIVIPQTPLDPSTEAYEERELRIDLLSRI